MNNEWENPLRVKVISLVKTSFLFPRKGNEKSLKG